VWRGQQKPIDYVEAERAWEIAKAAILSGLYKTIILDELNPTVDLELLPVESIHQTLLKKPVDKKMPFFSLVGISTKDNWLCARGRGGGLAIWVKS